MTIDELRSELLNLRNSALEEAESIQRSKVITDERYIARERYFELKHKAEAFTEVLDLLDDKRTKQRS